MERQLLRSEEPWSTLSRVVEYRRQCTGLTETGLWALDLMQGDLGYVSISAAVGGVIRETILIVLAGYGICVSMSKRAEDEAAVEGVQPNERMLYIGAGFYMRECECPKFRCQHKSLARFEEVMRECGRRSRRANWCRCCYCNALLLACASSTDVFNGGYGDTSTVALGASENGVVTTA